MIEIAAYMTGAGGVSAGFIRCGYSVDYFFETRTPHVETAVRNLRPLNVFCDPKRFFEEVPEDVVLLSSPPCADFSYIKLGSGMAPGLEGRKGWYTKLFGEMLCSKAFSLVVFESLPSLFHRRLVEAYHWLLARFAERHRILFAGQVNMALFGVPQKRRRLIIIATKHRSWIDEAVLRQCVEKFMRGVVRYPLTPLEVFEGRTLVELEERYLEIMCEYNDAEVYRFSSQNLDLIADYAKANRLRRVDLDVLEEEHKEILRLLNYYGVSVRELQRRGDPLCVEPVNKRWTYTQIDERMWRRTLPGEKIFAIFAELARALKKRNKRFNKGFVRWLCFYKRVPILRPSFCLVHKFAAASYEYSRRFLWLREIARLQTYDDEYWFAGKGTKVTSQIVQGVPPLFAIQLVKHGLIKIFF